MQTIIVAIDLPGCLKKRTGRVGLASIDPGLCCAQFQPDVSLSCFGQACIECRCLLLFPRELIRVGQLRHHISVLGRNSLQRRDRLVVFPLIAVLFGGRP